MKETEGGRYSYIIAPEIIEKIESLPEKDNYYRAIYAVVEKCVTLIDNKQYLAAKAEYVNMIDSLKLWFLK